MKITITVPELGIKATTNLRPAKKKSARRVTLEVTRKFKPGAILEGISHTQVLPFQDRGRAAYWVRAIRRNSRRGSLDYTLTKVKTLPF